MFGIVVGVLRMLGYGRLLPGLDWLDSWVSLQNGVVGWAFMLVEMVFGNANS